MATRTIIQRSFATGELSPALSARADLAKYQTALRACRNFWVQRHGGVANRPGTKFIGAAKGTATKVQLLRYVSEIAGESILIEMGHLYFRFFKNGAAVNVAGVPAWNGATTYVIGDLVVSAAINYYCIAAHVNQIPPNAAFWYPLVGTLYEIPHPFTAPTLARWEQSGAIITLTDQNFTPHELTFVNLTRWTVIPITTKPAIAAPTGLTGTGSSDTLGQKFDYKVTAADKDSYEESEASNTHAVYRGGGPTKNLPFSLGWNPSVNAGEYYVYLDPFRNGIYGYIATTVWDGITPPPLDFVFNDIGFPPDFSQTPPVVVRLFNAANKFPAMSAYFQQRRFFANTKAEPESVWGSRLGFIGNFGISSPLQDDDAINFRLAAKQRQPVQHLIGLKTLVLLTDTGEWIVRGSDQGPLIPTSVQADQVAYWGASKVVPAVVGQSIIYVQTRGRIVRDLQLDPSSSGLNGRDLTLLAGHLFKGLTISRLDFAQNPHSIVWAIRSDGGLLGLTYVPDDDVWGWHRHDSGASAVFEDVCVVPETDEDAVYLLVTRTINAATVRYIERLANREFLLLVNAFFVDAGLSYSGAPISVITGLGHLEQQILAVLGDGTVVFNGDPSAPTANNFKVVGGSVTLPAAYSVIHAGIPIRHAEIETVNLDAPGTSIRDKRKRVQGLTILVEKSSPVFQAGPDAAHLLSYRPETWQPASGLVDDALQQEITAGFDDYGRIVIRQTEPLPLTILGVLPNLEVGG